MMGQHIGGLVIFAAGLAIIVASVPVLRFSGRSSTSATAQIGNHMLTWLMRIFGTVVSILGIVTMIQQ